MAAPSCAGNRSRMLYLTPDELTPAAECAIVRRLLKDGDDPNAWTVTYVWAGDAAEPVYAVVLEDAERVRAFTVWPEGDGYEVVEVTDQ